MKVTNSVQKLIIVLSISFLAGCGSPLAKNETIDLIQGELGRAAVAPAMSTAPDSVSAALLPPIRIELPQSREPVEERFGITFNNVPAPQFFMGIVANTRYSMLVHPEVSGTISVNLKDVTVFEALDAVRELYGYDYKVEGTRIYVKPLTLQTRVFHVNYLTGSRRGASDIRVSSGSVADSTTAGSGQNNANTPGATQVPAGGSSPQVYTLNSSKISTTSTSDFWSELKSSLEAIVGNREGRSVVVSPQSGVIVVRGMWEELKNVSDYLKAAQISVDRQVILDAKIIEVELSDSYQSGVNWSAFRLHGNSAASYGMLSPGTSLSPLSAPGTASVLSTTPAQNTPGNALAALPGSVLAASAANAGTLFGLAFQTSDFAALISFLETQGNVHVLSSPRIATLNNQKAVLKVGRDEFFVTNVSTTTTAVGSTSTTSPTVTVQPFFSGVALDVTPQIDDSGNIVLHIHPSVSSVTTVDKPINLGTAGTFNLPLASSSVSETDSVVRGRDGQIVAIGGLMRQATTTDRSQLPGAGNIPVASTLLGNTRQVVQKRELVILLKPTIVHGGETWAEEINNAQRRVQTMRRKENLGQ